MPGEFTPSQPKNPMIAKMLAFLSDVGIDIQLVQLSDETFLPGIDIRNGVLLIDEARLAYPGDILHEAGHLAILPAARRRKINHDAGADAGEEMTAIAWSYAAAIYLQIDPSVVFHDDGYRGGARAILENFAQGRYFGVPVLQWLGMTMDDKAARQHAVSPYPHMIKWVMG
jgi:hypothetical protein